MPKIIENFYENNIFTFDSYSVDCVTDTIHENPNQPPKSVYKLMSNTTNQLHFAYAAQKGLVKLNSNGTISDSNILGSFIALKNNDSEYAAFFKKYGFIFPISNETFEEIHPKDIETIINRLKYTVELMSGISSIRKNYNKFAALIILLLFSEGTSIKTSLINKPYNTCTHIEASLIENPSGIPTRSDIQIIRPSNTDYYVYDSILEKRVSFDISFYNSTMGGYESDTTKANLLYLYVNYYNDTNLNSRKCIELLYHLLYDFGEINDITEKGIIYQDDSVQFSPEIQSAIIDVAKYVIGNEINANLSGIYPVYNTDIMSPSWKVDSLLSALYFSLFYIKPDMELYRQCANPRCGKYFLVKTTSTRTKYCSSACCNRVTQDTYRRTKRTKKEQKKDI